MLSERLPQYTCISEDILLNTEIHVFMQNTYSTAIAL